MTSLTREIWGREFDIPVRFKDLDDEGIDKSQWDAYGRIVSNWSVLDDALPALKEYCLVNDADAFGSEPIDNVFRYVIPKYLYVSRNSVKRVVALICDYRFDPEHGIAIVFENEALATIGTQDVIL